MNKQHLVAALAAFSLLACGLAAQATPTLAGPSGLAVLPDTTTTAPDYLDIALDYHASDSDTGLDGVTAARGTLGISKNSEFGMSYRMLQGATSHTTDYDINYKYTGKIAGTRLAAGAQFFVIDNEASGTGENTRGAQIYVAATRELTRPRTHLPDTDLTVGVNYTSLHSGTGVNPAAFRPFATLSVDMPAQLKLNLEAQAGNGNLDSKPLTSVSVTRNLGKGYAAQAGMSNLKNNLFGGDDQRLFFGISYHMYNGLGTK